MLPAQKGGLTIKTAVSYARYSSAQQHESSIEAQQAAIGEYARQHDIQILREYADRARSGTNDNRPAFQQLIAELKESPVDLVLVHKQDRFARNRYDAAVYSRLISQRGARLVAVAQDFGTGPESVILDGLMQSMAEYYSLNLSTEVIKGRKIRIQKGLHAGGICPFGYRVDEAGRYQIVEIEAYFVRRLYQAVLDGTAYQLVLDDMMAAGVRGHRGGQFQRHNISTLLKNPIYAGIYKAKAGDISVFIENNHPAIIDPKTYKEALKIMESRENNGPKQHRTYLLTRIAYCGKCGKPLYGHSYKNNGRMYYSYLCSGGCHLRSIPAAELEGACCSYIAALLQPEVRQQLTEAMRLYIAGQKRAAKRRTPDAKREIDALRQEIDAITQNLSAAVLPPAVVEKLGRDIQSRMERISILEELIKAPPQLPPPVIADYFSAAASVTPDSDPAQARRTLRRFIAQVTVDDHVITITSTFDSWLREHMPGTDGVKTLMRAVVPPDPDDPTPGGSGGSGTPGSSSGSGGSGTPGSSSGSGGSGTPGSFSGSSPSITISNTAAPSGSTSVNLLPVYDYPYSPCDKKIIVYALAFAYGVRIKRQPNDYRGCVADGIVNTFCK